MLLRLFSEFTPNFFSCSVIVNCDLNIGFIIYRGWRLIFAICRLSQQFRKDVSASRQLRPFLHSFISIFKFSYFSKSASFRSIISSIRSMYSVIFFTFSTRIRFVSLPLLVLIFSGKTSFVVDPAPQAMIVWRSSKVRPCLDTKVKENKLSLIKLIF